MKKLAEMSPDVEIEHEWADEDIGHNCGRYRYQNGVRIEEWLPETEREAIDEALSQHPHTFDAFLELLSQSGYTVKMGKHLTLCKEG